MRGRSGNRVLPSPFLPASDRGPHAATEAGWLLLRAVLGLCLKRGGGVQPKRICTKNGPTKCAPQ